MEKHDIPKITETKLQDIPKIDFGNKRMVLNPNHNFVEKITKRINMNDGYCPCQPKVEESNYTMCPCIPFVKEGKCCCKLYITIEDAENYRNENK